MSKVMQKFQMKITPAADGRRYSKYPDGNTPTTLATWNLPATISVPAGTSVGVRQYTADATGWTIAVTALAAGLTYNSGAETIVAADVAASTGTATFTLSKTGETNVVSLTTVALAASLSATSPTLFQDYGGFNLNGEPGALAVNDSWATTVYDYVPQYAPTIPIIPTPTGAGDEVIVTSAAQFTSTLLNNTSIKKVFIQKGTDLHNLSSMTLTAKGTAQSPRWFIWYDPDNTAGMQEPSPWDMQIPNRVEMPTISCQGAEWTYFVGLAWGRYNVYQKSAGDCRQGASFLTWYRCLFEGWGGGSNKWEFIDRGVYSGACMSVSSGSDTPVPHDLTWYKNVFRWCIPPSDDPSHPSYGKEPKCLNLNKGYNYKVISNDTVDGGQGFVQVGLSGDTWNVTIEDNDIGRDWFFDSDGTYNPDGLFTPWEGFLAFKRVNQDTLRDSFIRVYGNRFWGGRRTSAAFDPTPGSGVAFIQTSANSVKYKMDFRWNVFHDTTRRVFALNGSAWNDTTYEPQPGQHSIVRNILSNSWGIDSNSYPFYANSENTEVYLNTVVDAGSTAALHMYYRHSQTTKLLLHDQIGNLYLDTTVHNSTGSLGTTSKIGYNCYAGQSAPYSKDYGNDFVVANRPALALGNFTYLRRKLTGRELHTINGIVPTTQTMAALGAWRVPTTGANQIGSRVGIGVDDVY